MTDLCMESIWGPETVAPEGPLVANLEGVPRELEMIQRLDTPKSNEGTRANKKRQWSLALNLISTVGCP